MWCIPSHLELHRGLDNHANFDGTVFLPFFSRWIALPIIGWEKSLVLIESERDPSTVCVPVDTSCSSGEEKKKKKGKSMGHPPHLQVIPPPSPYPLDNILPPGTRVLVVGGGWWIR